MHRLAPLAFAATVLLAGCAGNPIVPIEAPGFSLAASSGSDVEPALTLKEARRLLMRVRATYRERIATQLGRSQNLQSGLVVLGAAVAGMAAGGVHADAIVGATLLGGTAFAIGTLNLDQRRLLAYDAGIRALDCANEAVIPLDLDVATQGRLTQALEGLAAARKKVATRLAALEPLAADPKLADRPEAKAASQAAAATQAALAEADRSRQAAERLGSDSREAGQRLQSVVYAVAAKVDGVIIQTVPDLASVGQVVGGLGGYASAFAPGAGLDKRFAAAFKGYDGAAAGATARSASEEVKAALAKLDAAVKDLRGASDELVQATGTLDALLKSVDGGKVADALKACNVGDVVLPLEVDPAEIQLEARSPALGKGFAIAGGTKPYSVRLLDAPPDGLNLGFGGGFADTAQVSAAAGVPAGSYRVQVSEASPRKLSRQVLVTVGSGSAPKSGPDAAPESSPAPAADAAVKAVASLAKTLAEPDLVLKDLLGAKEIRVAPGGVKATADGMQLELTLACKLAASNAKVDAAKLAERLLALDKAAQQQFAGKPNPIVFKASEACVKG